MRSEDGSLTVLEKKESAWNDHCAVYPDEFECMYSVEATQRRSQLGNRAEVTQRNIGAGLDPDAR